MFRLRPPQWTHRGTSGDWLGRSHWVLLGVCVILMTVSSVTLLQSRMVLLPTLNLTGKAATNPLLGSVSGDVNGVRLTRYSATETASGIDLFADEHVVFTCATGGPVIAPSLSGTTIRFWGYEYSDNEVDNLRAGKVGRELFDGRFFLSAAERTAARGALDHLHTLDAIVAGKRYYFMQEAPLRFRCGSGVDLPFMCGDGVIDANEECDDADTSVGDGCDDTCRVEPDYVCAGEPSVCLAIGPVASSASSSSSALVISSIASSSSSASSVSNSSASSGSSATSSSSSLSAVPSSSSVSSAPPSSSSAASSMSFPASDTINRPVLSQANFTYLGSFKLPTSDGGSCSTAFSPGGLTHRYVDGQLRFLTTSSVTCGNLVYETNFPGMSVTSPPTAQVVRHWGDVYTGRRWIANDGGTSQLLNGTSTYGLYYDSASSRLYWNYGHWYNADFPFNPSVGYSILDDATGVATGMGAWSLASRAEKFTRGGVLKIPQWFANRFTGGRTLGVGFGGYFSIVVSSSLGPALSAIAPPDLASAPDRSALPNTPLLGYPHSAAVRAHRDAHYHTTNDSGWNPQNGVGYWTWSDIIYGAASWIDVPSVQGVLFIAKIGQGRIWYESADRHAERGRFEWFVYDPKDLAAVATGAKEQWHIQPLRSWTTSTLPMPIDQSGWAGDGYNQVGGVTFDEASNRLFVLVTGSYKSGVEWHPQVHVYQVE